MPGDYRRPVDAWAPPILNAVSGWGGSRASSTATTCCVQPSVFSAQQAYRESDRVDANDELGSLLVEAENQLRELVDPFCTAPGLGFSGRGPSAFN